MREKHSEQKESKGICYEALEEFAREKIRGHLQYLLEEEVTEWLGQEKSERKGNASEQPRVSQRLRQEAAVYVKHGDRRDSSAAGKGFGGAVYFEGVAVFQAADKAGARSDPGALSSRVSQWRF